MKEMEILDSSLAILRIKICQNPIKATPVDGTKFFESSLTFRFLIDYFPILFEFLQPQEIFSRDQSTSHPDVRWRKIKSTLQYLTLLATFAVSNVKSALRFMYVIFYIFARYFVNLLRVDINFFMYFDMQI